MTLNHTTTTLDREHQIDRHLGRMLSTLRHSSGLSLESVAERTGLPIEELADHEAGLLPIPLSRMLLLIEVLNRPSC